MKISIVTVCYNSAKTIEQTIRSVLEQPYQNKEYIIIDGGSTDGTVGIIQKYEKSLAYWRSEPDGGLYDAMNKGIRRATGEIVGIINSDDWYGPTVFGEVVKAFQTTGADVLYGDVINVSAFGGNLYKSSCSVSAADLHVRIVYEHPTVFIRRELYERYGLFDCRYRISADYELLLRLYCKGACFVYLPRTVAFFRLDGGVGHRSAWRACREDRQIALRFAGQAEDCTEAIRQIEARFAMKRKRNSLRFLYERVQKRLEPAMLKRCWDYFLDGAKPCVIFGAGEDGIECYRWLRASGWNIRYFIDNAKERQKESVGEVPIRHPEILLQERGGVNLLIALTNHQAQVKAQLDAYGFAQNEYFDFYELQERFLKRYASQYLPWLCKTGGARK